MERYVHDNLLRLCYPCFLFLVLIVDYFFFNIFIYFSLWLHWVFVVACGILGP